ncbi:MAG: DUF1326 domain-containing protein [Candidatus Lokiarchaeota archaeon]|nr:DUF1326 domain-containing protein [Candidatus Lokiarchaeota archaeon]
MSKEVKERISWSMKGVWYEACAAEGHCSFYFGRDRETPCKSFQLYQIDEGKIGDVDIGGVMAIHVIDLYSNKAADVLTKGGEGGVYLSNRTTEEQKRYLEPFFINRIPGGMILSKVLGIKYVDINLNQEGSTFHVNMPYGEMKLSYTPGLDGKNPQRLENSIFGMYLSDLKICNTHFWKYNDFGRNWEFKNRSGVIANFDLKGKSRDF